MSLARKEVLGVQSDPRSPEHGQYGFLQDLVRHVAYETLSKRERKARHLAAAAHLETSSPTKTTSPKCSHPTTSPPSMPGRTRTMPTRSAPRHERCWREQASGRDPSAPPRRCNVLRAGRGTRRRPVDHTAAARAQRPARDRCEPDSARPGRHRAGRPPCSTTESDSHGCGGEHCPGQTLTASEGRLDEGSRPPRAGRCRARRG